jgi:hypothetical protein
MESERSKRCAHSAKRVESQFADRTTFEIHPEAHRAITTAMERPAKLRPELVELFRRARPE